MGTGNGILNPKSQLYASSVLSVFLYGSEPSDAWDLDRGSEKNIQSVRINLDDWPQ